MDNYVKELKNDIEAGADERYLMEVNESVFKAGLIDVETWKYIKIVILNSKFEKVV